MRLNYLSVTFWFNYFDDHSKFIEIINKYLENEFEEHKLLENTDNYFQPILTFANNKTKSNILFSKINLQYNMDLPDLAKFQKNVLAIYEALTENGIEILHTALFTEGEMQCRNALTHVTQNIVNSKILSSDLVDANFKFGKKYDDIFYKIISLMNKSKIDIPRNLDVNNNITPMPLVSWKDVNIKEEIIEFFYEINDKLSFDSTFNYHTIESYLNKMLYILKNDMQNDIKNLIDKGEF